MICIFPLLPYSLPILDTGRSACIDDRRLAHLWKSTSLIFGKFHRRRPSFESAPSLMKNDIYNVIVIRKTTSVLVIKGIEIRMG